MLFRRKFKQLIKLFVVTSSFLFIGLRLYTALVDSSGGESPVTLTPRVIGTLRPGAAGALPPRVTLRPPLAPRHLGANDIPVKASANTYEKEGDFEGKFNLKGLEVIRRLKNFRGGQPNRTGNGLVGQLRWGSLGDSGVRITAGGSLNEPQRGTKLSDIFIGVKTTAGFHRSRVGVVLETWYNLARDQVFFFTDADDAELSKRTGDHVVNTNCSASHYRDDLCCKMAAEIHHFVNSPAKHRWFCHVDDDNYVNIPALVRLLQGYNHVEDWYIGKPSVSRPITVPIPGAKNALASFWFATGGAGFCLSRGLALKLTSYTAKERLQITCAKIRLPDDCTIGFIMHEYLHVELTQIFQFHSHLERLQSISSKILAKQLTLSYSDTTSGRNIVNISGFNQTVDPTRFLSVHCFLFPNSSTRCL